MTLINILRTVRSAAHCVSPSQIAGYPEAITNNFIGWLKILGLVVESQGRTTQGRVYTSPLYQTVVDDILSNNSNMIRLTNLIVGSPASVSMSTIEDTIVDGPAFLAHGLNLGWFKPHARKSGFYYSAPEMRAAIGKLLEGESRVELTVTGSDTTVAPVAVAPLTGDEIAMLRSMLRSFTGDTEDLVLTGRPNLDLDPDQDEDEDDASEAHADTLGEVKPGVLALLRLSEHGVSVSTIIGALSWLADEGMIRTDSRDFNLPEMDKRYFVRKDKRPAADSIVALAVLNNDSITSRMDD